VTVSVRVTVVVPGSIVVVKTVSVNRPITPSLLVYFSQLGAEGNIHFWNALPLSERSL